MSSHEMVELTDPQHRQLLINILMADIPLTAQPIGSTPVFPDERKLIVTGEPGPFGNLELKVQDNIGAFVSLDNPEASKHYLVPSPKSETVLAALSTIRQRNVQQQLKGINDEMRWVSTNNYVPAVGDVVSQHLVGHDQCVHPTVSVVARILQPEEQAVLCKINRTIARADIIALAVDEDGDILTRAMNSRLVYKISTMQESNLPFEPSVFEAVIQRLTAADELL